MYASVNYAFIGSINGWLLTCLVPSHYLNPLWLVFIWTFVTSCYEIGITTWQFLILKCPLKNVGHFVSVSMYEENWTQEIKNVLYRNRLQQSFGSMSSDTRNQECTVQKQALVKLWINELRHKTSRMYCTETGFCKALDQWTQTQDIRNVLYRNRL